MADSERRIVEETRMQGERRERKDPGSQESQNRQSAGRQLDPWKQRKWQKRQEQKLRKQEEQARQAAEEEARQRRVDEQFMREALKQAKKALAKGEVPIGCVIVKDGAILARGYNRRNTEHSALAHAELQAIRRATARLQDWRLSGCTMYVTLEPCQMCAGAIVQSRIPEVVIGCRNPKAGCCGSILNLLQEPRFHHQVLLREGILQEEASRLLTDFFCQLRTQKIMPK